MIYNLVTVSQHINLLAVPGDKYSLEKLQKTKDNLMEFRDTANALDKTRVDSWAKKHGNVGEMCDQDFREGSPLHLGDEEDEPHQVTHGTTQTVSDCRICKWIDGKGRKALYGARQTFCESPQQDVPWLTKVCGNGSLG